MRTSLVIAIVLGSACSVEPPSVVEPLGPLPPPSPASTDRFRDAAACAQCHLVPDTATVLHDGSGDNVSPVLLWRASMMGLAARDPYYLAVFAEELARAPANRDVIEAMCTRCHAPAGSEELADRGEHLGFDELTSGDTTAAVLGRGGVTCTVCHQIAANNLGEERSFTGGFSIGYQRELYGRYLDPVTGPMMLIVDYTPTPGDHIARSELCATCHTVIVPGAAGDVVEQATYLEWRSSTYATTGRSCQSCHVPTLDRDGDPISTIVASFGANLRVRTPVGRHTFVGGNSYLLALMADAADWLGAGVSAAELMDSAARDEVHLREAARLTVAPAGAGAFTVGVENLTGHKLPTGYPSRRMWLHVTVQVAGVTVFESGRVDERGEIVDAAGSSIAKQPHRDEVASDAEVQIWQAVLVDRDGEPTHRALDAHHYSKDDRILPAGFAPFGIDLQRTEPVGVVIDPSFVPGSDAVTFRVPGLASGATISVELLYEALAPQHVDAIEAARTSAGTKFVELVQARPIVPVVMAQLSTPYVP